MGVSKNANIRRAFNISAKIGLHIVKLVYLYSHLRVLYTPHPGCILPILTQLSKVTFLTTPIDDKFCYENKNPSL